MLSTECDYVAETMTANLVKINRGESKFGRIVFSMLHYFSYRQTATLLIILCAFIGTLSAQTPATITLSNLAHRYDGNPKAVIATTSPSGLSLSITYAGQSSPPVNAGLYSVVARITDPSYTGSATATLRIAKANQTISIDEVPDQILGSAQYQVVAKATSGLPISRWDSSNPSVATINNSGLVTIVGAGQTSIIARQTGDLNFNAANMVGIPLNVFPSNASLPPTSQEFIFNASPRSVVRTNLPTGEASLVTYRNLADDAPSAAPEVVFQNGPDTLDLSYASTPFTPLNVIWALGKSIKLGGSSRRLHSCDVILVNTARFEKGHVNSVNSEWLNANPTLFVPPRDGVSIPGDSGGYYHPITVSFYDYDYDSVTTRDSYKLLITKTVTAFIPWRPQFSADGSIYPLNGFACRVSFEFPDGVLLPDTLFVAVSYNTSNTGKNPTGVAGPYDLLNVANIPSEEFPKVGDVYYLPSTLLYQDWVWYGGLAETIGPMFRIRATETTETHDPPVDAGIYEVKIQSPAFPVLNVTSKWTIHKAPVQISVNNTDHIFNNSQKNVTVATIPTGIPTTTTFTGLTTPPSSAGRYPYIVTANHKNYTGQIEGVMTVKHTVSSWKETVFAGKNLSPEQIDDAADPNGDGINNLMAYATNSDPLSGSSSPISTLVPEENLLSFTYRSNALASDLIYTVEMAHDFSKPDPWVAVVPIDTSVLSSDGNTKVNRIRVEKPKDQNRCFFRLKVRRATP